MSHAEKPYIYANNQDILINKTFCRDSIGQKRYGVKTGSATELVEDSRSIKDWYAKLMFAFTFHEGGFSEQR